MADTPNDEAHQDTFGARSRLSVGDATYEIHRIDTLADWHDVARLPYSIKVILENLLRHEDGLAVKAADIESTFPQEAMASPRASCSLLHSPCIRS